MGKFTMTHDLDCDVEKFWDLFLNGKEFNEKLFAALEFPEWKLVDQHEEGDVIVRTVKATPKMEAPAAVVKILGDRFGYTEHGRYDKKTKIYKFDIETTAMKDKLKNGGVVRCEANGEGKSKRIVDITAEAKVFGLGGVIESSFEKSYRSGWGKSAEFINEWVKKH
ncbi:MAG TPA: DUF2505 family protein [Labilithrix sp.]